MRVFITGASGHVGSAVVPELLTNGHQVVALARSEASAEALTAAGAEVVRGTLDDLGLLREQAAASDGVIHLAFKHDAMFSGDVAGATAADLAAIEAIGDGLAGSDKPFVGTSGTMTLAFGPTVDGADGAHPGTERDASSDGPRAVAEQAVLALADRGVRSSVVRLSPSVHSAADKIGFVPTLITVAREAGFSGYPGDGTNRWPAVHTLDAAVLYRLAVEQAQPGSVLHGVADEGVTTREIAEAIGRGLGIPVQSVAPEDAAHFTYLAGFVQADNPTSSAITRETLGWTPTHPGLIDDIDANYFAEEKVA